MAFDIQAELREQLQDVTAKLKASADEFEPASLEPNQSMLLFRIITEAFPGFRFDGRAAK